MMTLIWVALEGHYPVGLGCTFHTLIFVILPNEKFGPVYMHNGVRGSSLERNQ